MRWADERWVKLYTRDTPEWAAVSLGARGLFYELTRKVDGAGILHLGRKGTLALAACVRGGPEEVKSCLDELLEDGCVVLQDDCIVIPNFVEAQEARASDTARKRMQRERDRDQVLAAGTPEAHSITGTETIARHERSREVTYEVTPGHTLSREVTSGHAASHGVTPGHDQNRPDQNRPEENGDARASQRRKKTEKPPDPRFKPLQDALCATFEVLRGSKYLWAGAKDTEALKRLMASWTDDDIIARWGAGIEAKGWLEVATIAQLASKWNDLTKLVPAYSSGPSCCVPGCSVLAEATAPDGVRICYPHFDQWQTEARNAGRDGWPDNAEHFVSWLRGPTAPQQEAFV